MTTYLYNSVVVLATFIDHSALIRYMKRIHPQLLLQLDTQSHPINTIMRDPIQSEKIRCVQNSDLLVFKNSPAAATPGTVNYSELILDISSSEVTIGETISVTDISDFSVYKGRMFELTDYASYTIVLVDEKGVAWYIKNYDWTGYSIVSAYLKGNIEIPLSDFLLTSAL